MAHIGPHHVEAVVLDDAAEFVDAAFVGGDLRLEVGDVLGDVAAGPWVIGEQVDQVGLAEAAAVDQAEIVDQDAFLVDRRRQRRHRAGRRAADIGMVAARGDPEQNVVFVGRASGAPRLLFAEDRRADGDVGQVGAAVIGGVEGEDVAGMNVAGILADDRFHRAIHRAEMDRHVRGIGDQPPFAVEDRAGEVETLLDVDRIGGVLQRHAHLLGDRHEEVVEDFEHHRIGVGADRVPGRAGGRSGSRRYGRGR